MLTGLPRGVTSLRVWTTDAQRKMEEGPRVSVTDGRAEFRLDAASYAMLVAEGTGEVRGEFVSGRFW